jgi:hypothetical protein
LLCGLMLLVAEPALGLADAEAELDRMIAA